jgi:hypothetical protein
LTAPQQVWCPPRQTTGAARHLSRTRRHASGIHIWCSTISFLLVVPRRTAARVLCNSYVTRTLPGERRHRARARAREPHIETGTHGAFDTKTGELSSECTARAAQLGNPGSERFGAKPIHEHDGLVARSLIDSATARPCDEGRRSLPEKGAMRRSDRAARVRGSGVFRGCCDTAGTQIGLTFRSTGSSPCRS